MGTHGGLRRRSPSVEQLEDRWLRTAITSSQYYAAQAANVRHEYDHFVTEVQGIELQSQATSAEYLALRDDARALSEAALTSPLPPTLASPRALAVSVEIDRSPLYGSLSDQAWDEEKTRLAGNLAGLNVPQSLIDKTIADMKAVAASSLVSSDQYQTFTADLSRVREDESRMPPGYGHIPDPGLFFTQHLRGFFRGWAVQRVADEAKLSSDLQAASDGSTARLNVLNRDTQILQTLGAPITSDVNHRIDNDYAAAFAQGSPSASQLSTLREAVLSLLGPTATRSRVAAVDRLIADAPSFFQAAGLSSANVETIASDVRAVVDDGAGSPLDPFKVTLSGRGVVR